MALPIFFYTYGIAIDIYTTNQESKIADKPDIRLHLVEFEYSSYI
jgi:hypothetical protein